MKFASPKTLIIVVVLALSVIGATTFLMRSHSPKGLIIHDQWARPTPPAALSGAAYLSIANHLPTSDKLLSARGDIADKVEVHTHAEVDGLMKMMHLESLDIGAGETVKFQPGGLHLMLIGPKRPLVVGEVFDLTLIFEGAGEKVISVPVMEMEPDKANDSAHSGH